MFKNILAEPMKITTAYALGGLTVLGVWMLMNRQSIVSKGRNLMEEGLNMMDHMDHQCPNVNKQKCSAE